MSLPVTINVLGQRVTVRPQHASDNRLATNVDLLGIYRSHGQTIDLDLDCGPDQQREVMLHELVHVLLSLTGHDNPDRDKDERQVQALGAGLYQLLTGNPELVAWLLEH